MIDSENSQDNKNVLSEFLKDPTDKLLEKKILIFVHIHVYARFWRLLVFTTITLCFAFSKTENLYLNISKLHLKECVTHLTSKDK